jgi:hypothetical protein
VSGYLFVGPIFGIRVLEGSLDIHDVYRHFGAGFEYRLFKAIAVSGEALAVATSDGGAGGQTPEPSAPPLTIYAASAADGVLRGNVQFRLGNALVTADVIDLQPIIGPNATGTLELRGTVRITLDGPVPIHVIRH